VNIDPLNPNDITIYEVLRVIIDRLPSTNEHERARLIKAINNAERDRVFNNEGSFKL
jgi:hypothetical protein